MGEHELSEAIHQVINPKNPTQNAIGLLATMTDTKFAHVGTTMEENKNEIIGKIGELTQLINEHNDNCPLGLEHRFYEDRAQIVELKKKLDNVDYLFFFTKYKKLFVACVIGLIAIAGYSGLRFYMSWEVIQQCKANGLNIETTNANTQKNSVNINKITKTDNAKN
jgi:hypothetical protein